MFRHTVHCIQYRDCLIAGAARTFVPLSLFKETAITFISAAKDTTSTTVPLPPTHHSKAKRPPHQVHRRYKIPLSSSETSRRRHRLYSGTIKVSDGTIPSASEVILTLYTLYMY
jgi:hypothetical protein